MGARMHGEEVVERIAKAGPRRNKELLLYVHVPFCTSKCHFCDWVARFPTAELTDTGLQERYVSALCAQLRWYGPRLEELGYEITNVYWGGGTPTRLSADAIGRVNAAMADAFDLSGLREYSVECSPETLDAEKLSVFRQSGLNRISIGVQSFDAAVLKKMGRAHDVRQAYRAIELVQAANIENFNIDLILGYADDALSRSLESVERALELGIPHVAVFPFRVYDSSLISVRQIKKGYRALDWEADWYHALSSVSQKFQEAGYEQYALDCYARGPAAYFDAQLHYYTHRGDYFGAGLGAESFIGKHSVIQSQRDSGIHAYIEDPLSMQHVRSMEELSTSGSARTATFQALSTQNGVVYELWQDQFGIEPEHLRSNPKVAEVCARLESLGGRIVETERGFHLDPLGATAAFNRWIAKDQSDARSELRPEARGEERGAGAPSAGDPSAGPAQPSGDFHGGVAGAS